MQVKGVSIKESGQFSKLVMDYLADSEVLKSFHNGLPSKESFSKAINTKQFSSSNREKLVSVLTKQYENTQLSDLQKENLALLAQENTFTVTTGHQLNMASGPMYIVLKWATTIAWAKQLKTWFPEKNFVPIYWMATEDHDIEEIAYFSANGKKSIFDFGHQKGAVGNLTSNHFTNADWPLEIPLEVRNIYLKSKNLAEATRALMQLIIGEEGLLCLDPNESQLKQSFIPIMEKELSLQQNFVTVNESNLTLENAGYRSQAHPRSINLFYLKDDIRERIEKEIDGSYKVLNTSMSWSNKELILDELHQHPERFSPNVILRPIYQETILPNLGTILGPGEIAYWLQLKSTFEVNNVAFPILVPRTFACFLPSYSVEKLEKNNISIAQIFKSEAYLKELITTNLGENYSLSIEKEKAMDFVDQLKARASEIDITLVASAEAEGKRMLARLAHLENKLKKATQRKHAISINQILDVRKQILPNNSLQERVENYFGLKIANSTLKYFCNPESIKNEVQVVVE